ncbi:MAG: hypothetical protein HC892_22040 [Saprospiraceae bacterium]|nr:hypothetical protein [Saprospiraceae bacterium]
MRTSARAGEQGTSITGGVVFIFNLFDCILVKPAIVLSVQTGKAKNVDGN